MRFNCLLVSSLFFSVTLASAKLHAQQQTLTRAELERLLDERDALIGELQTTIRELTAQIRANDGTYDEGASVAAAERVGPGTVPAQSDAPAEAAPESADPTRFEVDPVAAERALERTLVQSGALLLPRGRIEFVPTLFYQVTETDLPVSVDTNAGAVIEGRTTRSALALDLLARIGLPGDSQLEIGLPFSSIEQKTRFSTAGMQFAQTDQTARATGDLRLGISKTLARERGWRPDIVGRLTYGLGNGDQTAGDVVLSSGFGYIDATLSFVKRRDPLALFFSLGYSAIESEGSVDPGDVYSVSLGTALAASPESSLFGAVTWRTASTTRIDGIDVSGSDVDFATISLGMSTIVGRGQLLNVAAEIGLSDVAPDYSLSFSLPMQW